MKPKGIPSSLHWACCQISEEYMNVVELERPCGMWLHRYEYEGLFELPFKATIALCVLWYWKRKFKI